MQCEPGHGPRSPRHPRPLLLVRRRTPQEAEGHFRIAQSRASGDSQGRRGGVPISYFDEGLPLTHRVIEIGEDFVVVQDLAGVMDTMVPVYSLKGIVKSRSEVEVSGSTRPATQQFVARI